MMIPSIWDTPFRYVVIRSICDSLLLFNELAGKLRLSDVSCILEILSEKERLCLLMHLTSSVIRRSIT